MARPRYHLAASAALGAVALCLTRSPRAAVAPIASGFLIDLDHLVDFALAKTRWQGKLLLLPLHGWEYLAIWAVLDRGLGTRGALAAGYALHLAIDQRTNALRHPLGYSVLMRAKHRFDVLKIGPRDLVTSDHRWLKSTVRGLIDWL
jgi:hypothetical protein